MMNKKTMGVLEAHKKGYLVDGSGTVWFKGKTVGGYKQNHNGTVYIHISIRMPDGKVQSIPVHQLHAYQKYGEDVFNPNKQTRHLDGNSLNNSWRNIAIGTASENSMDRPREKRFKSSVKAASYLVKYDANIIREDHKNGMSYNDIMRKYGISSKGTVSHIINKRIIMKPRVV